MPLASPDECVLFTMGMPACGKTTLVKAGLGHGFHTVVDSPLSSMDTARELRQIARESGRRVAFVYAHRPIGMAIRGMLERALPWREGRTVSLENMGTILVKGLALFLDLAESNACDDATTLDLIEVVDGRRRWQYGPDAARRIEAIRSELRQGGGSCLGQLACHWVQALEEAQGRGWDVPDLLVELVQENLDPGILAAARAPQPACEVPQQIAPEAPARVRSLADNPAMAPLLLQWAQQADRFEENLRAWREVRGV